MSIHTATDFLGPSEGEWKGEGTLSRPADTAEILSRRQLPAFRKMPTVGTTCLLLFQVKPIPSGKQQIGILIRGSPYYPCLSQLPEQAVFAGVTGGHFPAYLP